MAIIKLNNRSLGNNAVTSDAIATDAVTTAKIANNAVTFGKTTPFIGSSLFDWDASVASATASGWRTLSKTVTLPSDSVLETNWGNMMSVTFFGYISAGTYWYTWRIYDVTDNSVVQPISGPSSYNWYGAAGTGGFSFTGAVHGASNQAARVFDVTGRGGNGMTLELSASNTPGDVLNTSSQTLYADNIFFYAGVMSGIHDENGY